MKKLFQNVLIVVLAGNLFLPSVLAQDQPAPPPPPAVELPVPTPTAPPATTPAPESPITPSVDKPPEIYGGRLFNESDRYRLTGEGGIISSLLPRVATWMTGLLAAVAVLFLMYAGILFLTAGGEEEKISEATKTAVYVVLGLILAMFGYVLVYLFLTLFNPA
jgi:hypothetical protein